MESVKLTIEVDKDASANLKTDLEAATKQQVDTLSKKNLGGWETTVAIVQVVSPILTAIMPLLIELIRGKKVRRIRYGDIEIENPTEEQWQAVWQRYQSAEAKKAT